MCGTGFPVESVQFDVAESQYGHFGNVVWAA